MRLVYGAVVRQASPSKAFEMQGEAPVRVELFGVIRRVAGQAELLVPPGRLRDILEHLAKRFPGLTPHFISDRGVPSFCCVLLNGREIVGDTDRFISAGCSLQITTPDIGG